VNDQATTRRILRIDGRALPLRGDDIDTDRIIPARFLKTVRFDGLEGHVFEDDRAAWAVAARPHPFSDPAFAGAAVLVVNRNFGCGSSREHAPQALQRRGIAAVVGESFSEIFFGNALAIGLPCVTVSSEAAGRVQALVEDAPATLVTVDLERRLVTAGGHRFALEVPAAALEALTSGGWDATGLLLDDPDEVARLAARLPYIAGF
jgi:3-isopropylmalate/(R)-2-methylmalate dehydratase small subunit